jgi:outer membrane protein assembly factor BamB
MAFFCPECGKQIEDGERHCRGCGNEKGIFSYDMPPRLEMLLNGRYRIDRLIKTGGMGSVYRALDQKLDTYVALKDLILPPGSEPAHQGASEWFNSEAKMLARLDHPSLPRVFDYFSEEGHYYLVMTIVEGEDLETRLKREGKPGLPEDEVIGWACQVLKVLDYLHNYHPPIVYGDVKPSNIMLHRDGRVFLVDFGIARAMTPGAPRRRYAEGTDGYAPPEQFAGLSEPRSDLYALGATIHHLLTGEPPDPLILKPLKSIDRSFSSHIDQVVSKALEKIPGERFSTAQDMLNALMEYPTSVQHPSPGSTAAKVRFKFSTGGEILSSPAALGSRVYFGSRDKRVYCVDALRGDILWSCETGGAVTSSPSLMENRLFIGSCDWCIYCIDALTGRQIWNFKTGGTVESSPVVYGNRVYSGCGDYALYCLDIASGQKIWEYKTGGTLMSSPSIQKGRVYIGSFDQNLHCLDAESGSLHWRLDKKFIITSKVLVDRDFLYLTDGGNKLNCLSAKDGKLIWKYESGLSWISVWLDSSPAMSGGRLYFGSYDRFLYCVDSQNGRLIWKFRTKGKITTSPCVAGSFILFGSDDKRLYCLHAKDGCVMWEYETQNAVRSSPAVSGGRVYFGSNDNTLYCIDMERPALTSPGTLTGNCS